MLFEYQKWILHKYRKKRDTKTLDSSKYWEKKLKFCIYSSIISFFLCLNSIFYEKLIGRGGSNVLI